MAGPWYYRSLATGTGDGLSFANARTTLATMTSVVAGDTIYVADDHAESTAAALTINFPGTATNPNTVLCVDRANTGVLRTTATVSNSGSNMMAPNGSYYCYGITFNCGVSGSGGTPVLNLANAANNMQRFERCVFQLSSVGSVFINIGRPSVTGTSLVEFIDCTCTFGATSQSIACLGGDFIWRNASGVTAITNNANVPNTLFSNAAAAIGTATMEGLDFANVGSGRTLVGTGMNSAVKYYFNNCVLNSAVTISGTQSTLWPSVFVNASGNQFGHSTRQEQYTQQGIQTVDTGLWRSTGATDGSNSFSWRLQSAGTCLWQRPFVSLPITVWNATTGADVPIVIRGVANQTTIFNSYLWMSASYMGSVTNPQATIKRTGLADFMSSSSPLTADTSTWDGSAVLIRANSQAYTTASIVKVASNPGRVFFCIVAGTSAASEPAGYATATDGNAVTDGGATFRCGLRFQIALTLTSPQPQIAGPVYVQLFAGFNSMNIWIDPEINSA